MDHTFDAPSKLLDVYAIENRIRLTSTNEVLVAAERTIVDIVRQYLEPTLTNDAIRERAMAYTRDYLAVEDPIKAERTIVPALLRLDGEGAERRIVMTANHLVASISDFATARSRA